MKKVFLVSLVGGLVGGFVGGVYAYWRCLVEEAVQK